MARTERCNGCGRTQLVLPAEAKALRCPVCFTVTPVRSLDQIRLQGQVRRQSKKWGKDLMNHSSDAINAGASTMQLQATPVTPCYGFYSHVPRMPVYPSAHGKKRALLIGISYRSKPYELRGTVNDVSCMKYLLRAKFGFRDDSILVLTEDERDPYRIPTKQNIGMAMNWLVHDCQPGDSLVFHYSGHGLQQPDSNGDEMDGFDEAVCPLDFETQGMIVDDDINAILVRPLPKGVMLHALIDACHSGTVLDLPFLCQMHSNGFYEWENQSPWSGIYKGTNGGFVVAFSGCEDSKTSADTSALSGTVPTGVMTFCFIQAVETEPGAAYGRILTAMRSVIRKAATGTHVSSGPVGSIMRGIFCPKLTQVPQLSSSEPFDIYRMPFTL